MQTFKNSKASFVSLASIQQREEQMKYFQLGLSIFAFSVSLVGLYAALEPVRFWRAVHGLTEARMGPVSGSGQSVWADVPRKGCITIKGAKGRNGGGDGGDAVICGSGTAVGGDGGAGAADREMLPAMPLPDENTSDGRAIGGGGGN